MSNRTLAIIGLVLVAIGGVALVLTRAGSNDGSAESGSLGLASFSAASTTRVEIRRTGAKPIILTQEDGSWKIGGKAASADVMKGFFAQLSKARGATLASKNTKNHLALGATRQTGTTLVLSRSGTPTKYVVGSAADTPGSLYIKRDGASSVWKVNVEILDALNRDAKGWRGVASPQPQSAPPGLPPNIAGTPVPGS
jgi:hypothetical protein